MNETMVYGTVTENFQHRTPLTMFYGEDEKSAYLRIKTYDDHARQSEYIQRIPRILDLAAVPNWVWLELTRISPFYYAHDAAYPTGLVLPYTVAPDAGKTAAATEALNLYRKEAWAENQEKYPNDYYYQS